MIISNANLHCQAISIIILLRFVLKKGGLSRTLIPQSRVWQASQVCTPRTWQLLQRNTKRIFLRVIKHANCCQFNLTDYLISNLQRSIIFGVFQLICAHTSVVKGENLAYFLPFELPLCQLSSRIPRKRKKNIDVWKVDLSNLPAKITTLVRTYTLCSVYLSGNKAFDTIALISRRLWRLPFIPLLYLE